VIKNISLSFGINFINLLFPILLIPFYIKTFGINTYGLIAVSLALINIISVLYDYSWYALAPIEIEKVKNNATVTSLYISKIINTKVVLFIPSTLFLALYVIYFDNIKIDFIFSVSLFIFLFSRSQNTLCFFIGLNKVTPYFIINTILKIICIIMLFLCITKKTDYQYVFYFLGITDLLIFVISIIYLAYKCDFRYHFSSFVEISEELKVGFKLFLTNLTICVLLNSSTLLLGVFFNTKIAGIYNVAEKIIVLCKQSISVLFQGVYFKACAIGSSKTTELNLFLRSVFGYYFLLYSIGVVLLLVFPELIVQIISSESVVESSRYLIYLSPIPLIAALGQPAYMSLLLHHKKNSYFSAYFFGLIINLILTAVLSYFMHTSGIILALILTEIFITLYLNLSVFLNKKLNFFKKQKSYPNEERL
jgi:O-antigen/teichoic acid export membrane protein